MKEINKKLSLGCIIFSAIVLIQLIIINCVAFILFPKVQHFILGAIISSVLFVIFTFFLNVLTFKQKKQYKLLLITWILILIYFCLIPITLGIFGILERLAEEGFTTSWITTSVVVIIGMLISFSIPTKFCIAKLLKPLFLINKSKSRQTKAQEELTAESI